jgi:ribonucleoside-triphosphate reductase
MKNVLLATEAGLGHGRDADFPHPHLPCQGRVNYNPGTRTMICSSSAAASAPNVCSPTSVSSTVVQRAVLQAGAAGDRGFLQGCRTRVMAMSTTRPADRQRRGNLSFTSINLPRLAIESAGMSAVFPEARRNDGAGRGQLADRFEIQADQAYAQFPVFDGAGGVGSIPRRSSLMMNCGRFSSMGRYRSGSSGCGDAHLAGRHHTGKRRDQARGGNRRPHEGVL